MMSILQSSIPVTVITGFLGSGKTTLLSALLKKPEMSRTAVIINEFGKIGLDHCLIERTEENIIEMQNGCICCTIRGDLLKTLKDLIEKMSQGKITPFDRVVIETTGLANPVPIIHTLMTAPELYEVYTLDGVVTLVDATNGESTFDKHSESVKQAAMAERVIISKADMVDVNAVESLTARIKAINPGVTILNASHGNVDVRELFGLGTYDPYNKSRDVNEWLKHEAYHSHSHHHHHHDVTRHSEAIQAFAMRYEKPVNMGAFSFFMELVSAQVGPDLLRMKGIINVQGSDTPAVIHGVQHVFHPVQWLDKWPDEDRDSRLVFITNNIPKENIEGFFRAMMGVADEEIAKQEKQAEVA
jgi:G3E family GTPase